MVLVQEKKLLSELCTFQVGGFAAYFAEVHTVSEVQEAWQFALERKLPIQILGRGSNCLFDDRGFAGLVLRMRIHFIHQEQNSYHVGAGVGLPQLALLTAKSGFKGLEFAAGIPCTVGGAIYMNAGAHGQQTADTLRWVQWIDAQGQLQESEMEPKQFAYRHSPFQEMDSACIVAARFDLEPDPLARKRQQSHLLSRQESQPLEAPSAGCVFRNPPGASAGALIEKCGLKGLQMGGAQVSLKHGNFVVNTGNASSGDILALIHRVQQEVERQTGEVLKMEVCQVPYDPT